MNMKDYFTVSDLRGWLESVPQDERNKCLCIINGDGSGELTYLNLSTQDVEVVFDFEIKSKSGKESRKGLTIEREYVNLEELSDRLRTVFSPRRDIKEVVVLDSYGCKMTVSDILKKIDSLDPEMPLIYGMLDLKTSCGDGIGFLKPELKDAALESLVAGINEWNNSQNDKIREEEIIKEIPGNIDSAFLIQTGEVCEKVSLCDFSIYKGWE